jgi:hypothetical protein
VTDIAQRPGLPNDMWTIPAVKGKDIKFAFDEWSGRRRAAGQQYEDRVPLRICQ